MTEEKSSTVFIRNITEDDIQLVHKFIVNTQGPAENECDRSYLKALMKKGWLEVEGEILFPKEEATAPSKTDYLNWIVDNEGLHLGKIAISNGSIVGVLLCYTQSRNKKAYLSNIAVDPRYRRKGIGSTLMRELIDFYQHKSNIELIETNTGYTNGIAVKFYLEHNFQIAELRNTGYTMRHDLRKNRVPCTIRPYRESDFEDYALTLLETWPCDDLDEARESVQEAAERVERNKNEEIWVAEVNEKASSFILFGYTKVWGHKGESFENEAVGVDWLDVHPDFQGKGIAEELIAKAESRGRERGLDRIFMHTSVKNLSMINFASKNSFKFARYLEEFWGAGTGNAFLLVKEIG